METGRRDGMECEARTASGRSVGRMEGQVTTAMESPVESVRAALNAKLATLPNPDDVAAPNERERIGQMRQQVNNALSQIRMMESRIQKLDERLNLRMNRPWRDLLIELRDARLSALAKLEARPRESGKRANEKMQQEENAVRTELQILNDGTPYVHFDIEAMPGPLYYQIVNRGFGPDAGSRVIFQGRGGLSNVSLRIEALEHERAAMVEQLDRAVIEAERVLAI
jgi:hypothetical protein